MHAFRIAILTVIAANGFAHAGDKQRATFKILLPEITYREPEVKVDGTVIPGSGVERTWQSRPLESGKTYTCKVEAVIDPSNYVRIIRTRTVTFKAGETVT